MSLASPSGRLDESTHEQLIQALMRSLQLSHRARAHVYRTHISSIVVCADVAYKLRRPVKLPFADFSTLARRTKDCWREWQLNKRTAPALYLGVVTITGTPDAPQIEGQGEALDTALKMRRFEQSELLSEWVGNNQITTPMITELGHHLAQFMQGLPALSAARLKHQRPTIDWLTESLDEFAALKPDLETKIRSVRQWANTEHRRLQHLINQRQRQGFYRDGHGDLHLANLVRFEGHVMAFDALEFNADLRQIDIMGDIAFTFMDLLAFDRADLAWTLMNAWCEHTGDYAGLRLLRYYTLYRAVVRAKVAALSGNTSTNQRTLQRYWSLADQLIATPNPPRLVLLTGLSGSGKSTVAAELATHLSAIRLRADVIRKQLFYGAITHPDKLYSAKATRATYTELARLAKILLAQNMTVIVDATFLSQAHADRFDKLAKHFSIKPHILVCHAPVPELRRRIEQRAILGSDPSDATLAVLEQQLASQVSKPVQWPVPQTWLNTHQSITNMNRHIAKLARSILKS